MRLVSRAADVVVRTPAKVNLFLEALAKRADGYHEIATLMAAVRLYDTLIFKEESTGALQLACDHSELPTGPENLVVKAAHLLQTRTGCQRGADIRLVKRIPLMAGLAGGSSDAAATLVGLNRLWELQLPIAELANLGADLGSDVPFFLNGPAAWCTGRGERVEPVTLGRPLDLVLLCPNFGLATAAVYRRVQVPQRPMSGDEIKKAAAAGDVATLGRCLHNRLQTAAESLEPRIGELAHRLAELGPAGQLMSGSGSTLFALAKDREDARRLAALLRSQTDRENYRVHQVRSCSEQPRHRGPLG